MNILLVEDEVLIALDMQCVIEELGHNFIGDVASTTQLEKLNLSIAPHLVFIDLNLADGTSGLDACRMVHEKWTDVVVVFVTANPMKIPVDFQGSHGVISKPFSHHSFEHSIAYLSESMCKPPPVTLKPSSFTTFSCFNTSW